MTEAVLAWLELNEEPVKKFFTTYLQFLRAAGHHVLFGLPDFTDSKILATLPIDYALLSKSVTLGDTETIIDLDILRTYYESFTYHGITIEQINTYIDFNQYRRAELRAQVKRDTEALSITQTSWTHKETSTKFEIKFATPLIAPICPHELLFILQLAEFKEQET